MPKNTTPRPLRPYSANFQEIPKPQRPTISGSHLWYSTSSDRSFALPKGDE